MKTVITGSGGQLGKMLCATAPAACDVIAVDRAALDITDAAAVSAMIDAVRPNLVINAAAYTAVDRAESEPELAEAVNVRAVANLARAASAVGARLAHISTDFVFDGQASRPYRAGDSTAPLGVYGLTKRDGENAAGGDALIIRTAWVYGAQGKNFLHTMLRLMRERDEIRVVHDQIGTPTSTAGLARAIWELAGAGSSGIFHYADCGVASWYDFAVAIQEEASAIGLLDRAVSVIPVPTAEFPTPAHRPAFSVLDKEATWQQLGWRAPHWRAALRTTLKELREYG